MAATTIQRDPTRGEQPPPARVGEGFKPADPGPLGLGARSR